VHVPVEVTSMLPASWLQRGRGPTLSTSTQTPVASLQNSPMSPTDSHIDVREHPEVVELKLEPSMLPAVQLGLLPRNQSYLHIT
jgi:hypothetical protein